MKLHFSPGLGGKGGTTSGLVDIGAGGGGGGVLVDGNGPSGGSKVHGKGYGAGGGGYWLVADQATLTGYDGVIILDLI